MKTFQAVQALVVASLVVGVATFSACSSTPASGSRAASIAASEGPDGSELWGRTCQHCHNFRSPTELSDMQWEVALTHMRVRANLTGQQQRAILAFLQDSN